MVFHRGKFLYVLWCLEEKGCLFSEGVSRLRCFPLIQMSLSISGADLQGAILQDVVAFASQFNNTGLQNAVLEMACFMQSSFTDARISGADFTDAVVEQSQLPQLCQ